MPWGSRLLLCVLILAACRSVGAKWCYVGVVNGRVYDTTQEAQVCPVSIYGDNAACAIACARDTEAKTDTCSFLCIPAQHCDKDGRVHPVSKVSPGLYLPGCPKQENFEAVGDGKFECVSRCCTNDRCNESKTTRTHAMDSTVALVVATIISIALLRAA